MKVAICEPHKSQTAVHVSVQLAAALAASHPDWQITKWQEPQSAAEQTGEAPDILIYCGIPSQDMLDLAMTAKVKLYYTFEGLTAISDSTVQAINSLFTGVIAGNRFTKDVLQQSKVHIPIATIWPGLDSKQREQSANDKTKTFRFGNISQADTNSGVDILLNAYFSEFTGQDNVLLELITTDTYGAEVKAAIKRLQDTNRNPPPIQFHTISDLYNDNEVWNLIQPIDCIVSPFRADHDGRSVLPAMQAGKLVIATDHGAVQDVLSDEDALLIDCKVVDVLTGEVPANAKYAEPDIHDLQSVMRYAYENRANTDLAEKVARAKIVSDSLTWSKANAELTEFVYELQPVAKAKAQKLAVLTTQNTVCGIAEYSRDLYFSIQDCFQDFKFLANSDVADRVRPDDANVVRAWEYGETKFEKVLEWLEENKPDIFHIQMHTGHYPLAGVSALLQGIQRLNSKPYTLLTPHTVQAGDFDLADIASDLNLCDRILVHRDADLKHLSTKLADPGRVTLFPLPYDDYILRSRGKLKRRLELEKASPVIITHGLMSAHKGLLEMPAAIASLKVDFPNILWIAANAVNINNVTSTSTLGKVQQSIKDLNIEDNVHLITDFLDAKAVLVLLEAADIGVLAYSEVGESASAAIRKFLASGTPTIVTDIPMMAELEGEVYKIPNNTSQAIAAGIQSLWPDKKLQTKLTTAALEKSKMYSWDRMALRLLKIYTQST